MRGVLVATALALAIVTIAACQSRSDAMTSERPTKVKSSASVSIPDGAGGEILVKIPKDADAALLVSTLEWRRAWVASLDSKARMNEKYPEIAPQVVGDPSEFDREHRDAAHAKAYLEGDRFCNEWMAGRSSKVKAAARIYCTVWHDTLEAYTEADGNEFTSTAAGAQYIRAKAELEATAED